MNNAEQLHAAVAIRMGACRGNAGTPPPFVSLVEPTKDAPAAPLTLNDPLTAEAIAEVVARHTASKGMPPAVQVGAVGTFAMRPARCGQRSNRLRGCVAIVTGSAQGFGRGIAEGLVRDGSCVVVADLNEQLGRAFAESLNAAATEPVAVFHQTDVTRADSLADCAATAVGAFGGVDLLVANAGVLKAGGIEEMDESAFDLVTNVNYKAFFLCVRAVVPVMRMQRRLNPAHTADIVQVNSKSGLEGSNRNFAYAGSKFGGIGLVQSFALELVADGIKVNAVCPGNYFDGPLWSDPEKGLFVQYLRTGKVPGAKTIEDVRSFYLSKVPMRRGCLPEDVVTAILYLREQQYETGQALPITGGQVMLN
jgi:NAD(P)-dependent dehydrogenase (short-subunit alcohol dehydrogenase family)